MSALCNLPGLQGCCLPCSTLSLLLGEEAPCYRHSCSQPNAVSTAKPRCEAAEHKPRAGSIQRSIKKKPVCSIPAQSDVKKSGRMHEDADGTRVENPDFCIPPLPRAPWQMSVRVAPPAMNCGLAHSSWGRQQAQHHCTRSTGGAPTRRAPTRGWHLPWVCATRRPAS